MRTADVVIIGAGIIGLSVAYYLKREGDLSVLILEKNSTWIGGSTPRANGGFRQQFSTEVNIQLSQLSLPVFENFTEEFQVDIGLRQPGYLFVTATHRGEESLKKNLRLQNQHGVPVEWLETSTLEEKFPYLKTEDLRGGNFCARDGFADAYSIASGFGKGALALGCELKTEAPVVAIYSSKDCIERVRTPTMDVSTSCVVNAAGPYAALVGRLAGLDLPVQPVRRMLVLTEEFHDIPEDIPMTIDLDTGFLMRKESGKVLMGWSDPEEPPGFNQDFDLSFIDVVAGKATKRVPALEKASVDSKKSWAGLYEETPDHHCILGESSRVKGFFCANGFSGHGMMHAPATGMILTDLILSGKTERIDLHPLRPERFAEDDLIHETVVL